MMKRSALILSAALLALWGCSGGGDSPTAPSDSGEPQIVKVTSITPADGATGLEGLVTVSVTFDQVVSELIAVMNPGEFGVTEETEEWMTTEDGMTWTSEPLPLKTGENYWLIVFSAETEEEKNLAYPVLSTFTLNPVLPKSTISGRVATPGTTTPAGTVVMLVDAGRFGNGTNVFDEDVFEGVAFVTDGNGEFTIEHLKSGNYYLIAFKDGNGDGFPFGEGDFFGIFGTIAAFPEFDLIDLPNNWDLTLDKNIEMVKG